MSAIQWLISKSETETLEDGTVSRFFSGTIPYRMKAEIMKIATMRRDNNKSVSYSADGETWGWSARFGAMKSTANTVHFSYNDYRVPMGKAESKPQPVIASFYTMWLPTATAA